VKVARVELFLLRLALKNPFETSGFREKDRVPILLRVESDGAAGWGECVATEFPWYSAETPETCWYVLTQILVPRVLGRSFAGPEEVADVFAGVRGHNMAKATLEMACWDLAAKERGVSLSSLLGGTRDRILSGVSIGIQPSLEATVETIARELASGYQRVKLKIKPGWDLALAERVRAAFPDLKFMLDANSAYTLADIPLFKHLDACRPMMVEQPLEADDIVDHATLQREIETPICLDESIHGAPDARKAIQIGACRIVNIKAGRVGGHRESKRVHDVCAERGLPVWCGGMLETGVGRAHNVALASLPNFRLPGDVSASERYFHTEVIAEPFTVSSDGTIAVPTGPGIGVTVLEDVVRGLALRRAELR
jgi:O-succinylbenzoate synthase